MGSIQPLQNAIDLTHHLNAHSKARHPSPLKDILKFMAYDGMVSLAGGLPHPSLFPFQELNLSSYSSSTVLDALSPDHVPKKLDQISVSRGATEESPLSLNQALQYGSGAGDPNLRRWAYDFTTRVFQPGYADFEILLHSGNTDGWCKVVRLLCEPGDLILCEEHTYPSAQALWIPMGCKAVPIKMDSDGIEPESLEKMLATWDTTHPFVKRPHLLYIVPVGSNPTGLTMKGNRRQEIYQICVKYDIIICEDDPYSFLQYPSYQQGTATSTGAKTIGGVTSVEQFITSLAPSFLKFDYQGRVIRLDTFSKTLAPGSRLGYFIANPIFTERLLRATEVETQAPSGWSQAVIFNLLHKWGPDGYLTWLSNLRDQYQTRRDWMCTAIADNFSLAPSLHVKDTLTASSASHPTIPLFSFVPPTGGMFIWAKFYFAAAPRYIALSADPKCIDPEQTFADELWARMAAALVLLTPGSYYTPWEGSEKNTTTARGAEKGVGYFRFAFSMTTKNEMDLGIQRMAKVMEEFWELGSENSE